MSCSISRKLSVLLFDLLIALSQMFLEFWINVGSSFRYPAVSRSKSVLG